MSKVQILRALLKQRLPADDEEEIFELFDRTTAEYEEKLCGLKEENERQRKRLEAAFNSDDKTDIQLLMKEEIHPEHQKWTCGLVQLDQRHDIKNKEEELCISEEGAHLQVVEVDTNKCANDMNIGSLHCHQSQNLEIQETEHLTSSSVEQMKADSNGDNCGGSELACKF
ncbi:uncharacterized protein LOC117525948 [Thalassophryne amazonica]|uniref:uncharacterized protein LOC117525948 n=1 Tax=Thalassophryne amazonica TaxID=390379 RepID=UPI00147239B9|nr:uncharacterized protein LOC117525948 [Thalassophryne amazonica]